MISKRKPYNNKLGYVCSLKLNKYLYGVVYDNKNNQLDIDTGGLRYIAVREPIGIFINCKTQKLARDTIKMWREEEKEKRNKGK